MDNHISIPTNSRSDNLARVQEAERIMGIAYSELPDRIKKQIRKKEKGESVSAVAKAVPQDSNMNKTERNYANHLDMLKEAGEIKDWQHEPFNIRLAKRTFYKPDFAVLTAANEIEIHEVKGYFRDDALVKIKAAAEKLQWFRFKAVFWKNRRWEYRTFNP